MRGATFCIDIFRSKLRYFNPRTPCGVRRSQHLRERQQHRHFNPRTPCGVRPAAFFDSYCIGVFQSTHPMRGATVAHLFEPVGKINFNPRTPCGVRHGVDNKGRRAALFQSTHPMRGATGARFFEAVIIAEFQSTHPMRGATMGIAGSIDWNRFQSTHPMRGATLCRPFERRRGTISIHAPHAGCDRKASRILISNSDFNPRTPCGVRPIAGQTLSP